MYYEIKYSETLAHHGILGQKWGVRRYQNADGSLTSAGKARYGTGSIEKGSSTNSDTRGKTEAQKKAEAQKRADSVNRGTLTDAEIKQKIDRLQLEKQLRTLTDEELNPGKKVVTDVLVSAGKKTVTTALAGAALYGIKAAMSRKFDLEEFGNAMFNGGPKKK